MVGKQNRHSSCTWGCNLTGKTTKQAKQKCHLFSIEHYSRVWWKQKEHLINLGLEGNTFLKVKKE